jgi:uncharacterized membrane protein YphA (DoxX/SURF4 family)
MRCSAFAGIAIVPLLARLVLAAAFVPQGYHKLFSTRVYSGQDAVVLSGLGVSGTPVAEPAVQPVAWHQETRSLRDLYPPEERAQDPEGEGREPAAPPDAPEAEPPPQAPIALPSEPPAAPPAPFEARALYGIALILDQNGWPAGWAVSPTQMAWAAALTELLGGAILLIGLFSRLAGLGLAVTMGFAYYLTSRWAPIDPNLFAIARAEEVPNFNRIFCQLGLFVLAFGVFLTGAGPLSLDRLLFGGTRRRGGDGVEDGSRH